MEQLSNENADTKFIKPGRKVAKGFLTTVILFLGFSMVVTYLVPPAFQFVGYLLSLAVAVHAGNKTSQN